MRITAEKIDQSLGWIAFAILFGFLLLLAAGCGTVKPLRGGKATTAPAVTMTAPENPAASSRQTVNDNVETVIAIPAGSKVYSYDIAPLDNGQLVTNQTLVIPSQPTTLTRHASKSAATELGAAQKDTAREISAKLSAVRPLQILGVLILLAGVAMFHPVIRALVGSQTLQMGCFGVGLALIFLPMLLAGHETLILLFGLAGCGGLGVWWFAHRHGVLKATATQNQTNENPKSV